MNGELRSEYLANCALHDVAMTKRRSGLSARTQQLIAEQFGGDLDEAEYVAAKLKATCTREPGWVLEVLGHGEKGWRDPMAWAVRR